MIDLQLLINLNTQIRLREKGKANTRFGEKQEGRNIFKTAFQRPSCI